MLTHAEAATLLSQPISEVADVEESPAGDLITTTDGTVLINCVDPDAEGKTGLMYLAAPTPSYGGAFPVFAQEGAALNADTGNVPDGSVKVVLEWASDDIERVVAAHEAEAAKDKPRKSLIEALVDKFYELAPAEVSAETGDGSDDNADDQTGEAGAVDPAAAPAAEQE